MRTGKPVRDAILWNDGRTQPLIDRLSARASGLHARIFAPPARVMQQGCTLPVLRWLADHEPESAGTCRHVLCCKDWIAYKLTARSRSTRPKPAWHARRARTRATATPCSTSLASAPSGISSRLCCRRKASPGVSHAEAAGRRAAAGTPVVAGAGDVPASAWAGRSRTGRRLHAARHQHPQLPGHGRPVFEPRDVGVLFCLPGERWLRAMINVSGTTSLDWFIAQFCQPEKMAARHPPTTYSRA